MPAPVTCTVALIRDVFHTPDAGERLRERLREAKSRGAEVALLPEIAMNPWSPATRSRRPDDAEAPGGPRHAMQAGAAKEAGIGLVGAAIVEDKTTKVRRNTALVFNNRGELIHSYAKMHVPEEEGFWETSHYSPGERMAEPFDAFPMRMGVQICSDNSRPEGAHVLAALGAEAILIPRATVGGLYERVWKPIWRANALVGGCYVLSVNRPSPEQGIPLSGASIVVAPDGEVVLESFDPISLFTLERTRVEAARRDYPAYLMIHPRRYAEAWTEVARRRG